MSKKNLFNFLPQLAFRISHFKLLLGFCFLLSAFRLKAQTWELGAFGGAAGYQGDLNQQNTVKPSGLAAGIFLQRNLNPYFALKVAYTHGTIGGADSTNGTQQFRDRNLSFKTPLDELSLLAEFNLMRYTPGARFDHFSPYIYFGAGVTSYNPTATYKGVQYDLRPQQTEGAAYPNSAIVFPYGIGLKYNFSSAWNLMGSLGYRYVRSDYIDDVSGNYIDRSNLTPLAAALADRSGEQTGNYLGIPGTQRGDLRTHDTYLFIGFSISFTFNTSNCYY